jgi:hypothetical protein
MFYKDNWLTWSYDGVEKGTKLTPASKYELKITPTILQPVKSYKEELLANTRLIRDSFTEPFDLLFSGGVDSEVILRCNLELGIPINVFIFKYENNYNRLDVFNALRICNELNVKPTVIDFNLQRFFENDAHAIWKLGYFKSPGRLPHMKMFEYLDNIPILGDGEPWWIYDQQWLFEIDENGHSLTRYSTTIGRTVLADWYEYSPEVLISHLKTPAMQQLISNGPTDIDQFKYQLHKSLWPAIKIRPKLVGFETRDKFGNPIKVPEFMMDFRRQFIDPSNASYTTYRFTADELIKQLCLP